MVSLSWSLTLLVLHALSALSEPVSHPIKRSPRRFNAQGAANYVRKKWNYRSLEERTLNPHAGRSVSAASLTNQVSAQVDHHSHLSTLAGVRFQLLWRSRNWHSVSSDNAGSGCSAHASLTPLSAKILTFRFSDRSLSM